MKAINLKGITNPMSESEMKNVKGGNPLPLEIANPDLLADDGGGQFRCCCGMGTTGNCFDVTANSIDDAIWALTYLCPGGGGCFA